MKLPTDTITHEGEQFTVGYEEYLNCGNCGETWDVTSPSEEDETYREEPKGETICPHCGAASGHEYRKSFHFFVKQAWWFSEPEKEVAQHAEAFRHEADRLEALEANGWEPVSADGEHLVLEKVEVESTTSDHRVTDTLE